MPLVKEQPRYTYTSRIHQEISGNIYYALRSFLEGKPCKVYAAPFAVRLFPAEDESDDTVVEPDITVVCDSSKLDDRGCKGAPDLIIEIASPATARYDRIVKFNKYREAGVREYWIAGPEERAVFAYTLKNGEYTAAVYEKTAPVAVLPGCEIDLAAIFGAGEAVEA
ncbi:MAG: Uma2 family endonuclease [Treponema sp.]|nr:Uma2 family endonuclease [Treponema sp.]